MRACAGSCFLRPKILNALLVSQGHANRVIFRHYLLCAFKQLYLVCCCCFFCCRVLLLAVLLLLRFVCLVMSLWPWLKRCCGAFAHRAGVWGWFSPLSSLFFLLLWGGGRWAALLGVAWSAGFLGFEHDHGGRDRFVETMADVTALSKACYKEGFSRDVDPSFEFMC